MPRPIKICYVPPTPEPEPEQPAETPEEPAETPEEPAETPEEPAETPEEPAETSDEPRTPCNGPKHELTRENMGSNYKFKRFVNECPLEEKTVGKIYSIGENAERRLTEIGMSKVSKQNIF